MKLKIILLAGAAMCAIVVVPAAGSQAPNIHVTTLHKGAVVLKTRHIPSHTPNTTYTFTASVDTSISTASDYRIKTRLENTFAGWRSSANCGLVDQHIKLSTRKTRYAHIGTATETYSTGCPQPIKFYGDTYDLKTRKAVGKTDNFESVLIGRFKKDGRAYRGLLDLDVTVYIDP
jgi:hypothetical protein